MLNGGEILIATHNRGKVREFDQLLSPFGIGVISAADRGGEPPEETGTTFAQNALIKARAASASTSLPVIADDSGLCVAALDGAPGVYSARWAGETGDFGLAMEKVWQELRARYPGKSLTGALAGACFVCALALLIPGQEARLFEGRVRGRLVWPPRGNKGFGYDPIFAPEGRSQTFGEMLPEQKHSLSHRVRALNALMVAVREES